MSCSYNRLNWIIIYPNFIYTDFEFIVIYQCISNDWKSAVQKWTDTIRKYISIVPIEFGTHNSNNNKLLYRVSQLIKRNNKPKMNETAAIITLWKRKNYPFSGSAKFRCNTRFFFFQINKKTLQSLYRAIPGPIPTDSPRNNNLNFTINNNFCNLFHPLSHNYTETYWFAIFLSLFHFQVSNACGN